MANMFCGYCCVVYAMRGEFAQAALFIGFAFVLDMLDGRVARLTGTTSAFGVEFDSLADVISFGMAPAILAFTWGLQPFGRLGWAAGFLFVVGRRDPARALQHPEPEPGQALLRRHAESGRRGRARRDGLRVSLWPAGMVGGAGAADGAGAGVPDGQHDPLPQLQDVRPRHAPLVPQPDPHRHRHGRDRHASGNHAGDDGLHAIWPPAWSWGWPLHVATTSSAAAAADAVPPTNPDRPRIHVRAVGTRAASPPRSQAEAVAPGLAVGSDPTVSTGTACVTVVPTPF